MAIDFQKMFEDELVKSSAGYDEQIKGYENAQAEEQKALEAQRDNQEKKLQATRQSSQQDAYVSKRMAEKNMPQLLAAQGITGGMAETTASNVFNNYLKAKTAADSTYSTANSDLMSNYMTNSASLKTKYNQLLGEARQKQRDDAFTRAQFAYQVALAEEERRKQEEERRRKEEAAASSKKKGKTSYTPKYTNPNTKKAGTKEFGGYISPYKTTSKYDKTYANAVYGNKWR
ncbi:hypothetical protein CE91St36_07430 [Christensenellaceae bacterium]|nr:hypothetical protein CE91St36_07430 [Christensenellaceae bacterium]BDF60594.1 hypothetical protein CE91St37_07440 [Christensenellaceae bacterium]